MKSRLLATSVVLFCVQAVHAQTPAKETATVVVRGELARADLRDPKTGGFRKLHIIELESGKAYKIQLASTDKAFKPHLRVEDEGGAILEQDAADLIREKAELTFAPSSRGKFHVVVTSVADGETGAYTLSIGETEGESSVEFAGVLANTDPLDNIRQGCHQKVHAFRMIVGRAYTIDLQGQFDTYIRVETSGGKNLAEDDDGGDGLNSRLVFRPTQNDTYRVIVTSCGQGGVGTYKLKITSIGNEKLILNSQSALTNQDPLDKVRQGSRCKIYSVKMDAGRGYTIDLQSTEFDSYLRLEGPAGDNLAQDDDSGGNLNSRILYRPTQSGIYRVIATSLGGGATGNFSLTVRQN